MGKVMTKNNDNPTAGGDFLFAEAECCIASIMQLPEGSRLFATNYAAEDLSGAARAVCNSAQRVGLYVELPMPDDLFIGFMNFCIPYRASMSYGQISALFHASLAPERFTLVSSSPMLLDEAKKRGIRAIAPSQLPLANPVEARLTPVFCDAIDETKVFSRLKVIRNENGSPLASKTYWKVPFEIFRHYQWTDCSQKAFMERVNSEFHLSPAIKNADMQYAVKMIATKKDFRLWPDNPYRDFGCKIFDIFFGKRLPWGGSGLFVYEHEKEFMKPNRQITHSA